MRDWFGAAGFVLAGAIAACAPGARVVPPPRGVPRAETARALSQRPVEHQYYFDRNAMSSAAIVGPNVIALTRAGTFLTMDKATLALAGERFFSRRARVMGGADEQSVVVGFEGGRIARIDARSLADETLGTVPGAPLWVGRAHDGEPVVVFADRQPSARPGWRADESYRIWLGPRKAQQPIPLPRLKSVGPAAEAFYLDRRDRLWYGTDNGEWGGRLEVVDLRTGEVNAPPQCCRSNLYGFAETSSGQVLGFGGVMHMGYLETFVATLEPKSTSLLYWYRHRSEPWVDARNEIWLAEPEPHLPVTHVLERANGTFWLLSFNYLIEADPSFQTFRRLHKFSLRYSPGRPDAMGSYPTVTSAMLDGERLLFATQRDGLVEYANGQAISHLQPDQAPAESAWCFRSPVGLVFVGDTRGSVLTRDGRWKEVPLPLANWDGEPALEPDPEITDYDVVAARSAYEAQLRNFRREPQRPARVQWDERADLVAEREGLCLQTRGDGACQPCTVPGVDREVYALTRDSDGRIWLAGEGLWFVDETGHAIPVHPKLPFMTDATVDHILVADGSLVLSLGDRGVAFVDVRSASGQ